MKICRKITAVLVSAAMLAACINCTAQEMFILTDNCTSTEMLSSTDGNIEVNKTMFSYPVLSLKQGAQTGTAEYAVPGEIADFEVKTTEDMTSVKSETEDNCTDFSKIYSQSGNMAQSDTWYDSPVYGLAANEKTGWVEYRADGEISSFEIGTKIHGSYVYENTLYYDIYVSSDGESYTKLERGVNYTDNFGANDTKLTYAIQYNYKSTVLPEGIGYIKIYFPTLKDGEADINFQRSIYSVKIMQEQSNYKISSSADGSTYMSGLTNGAKYLRIRLNSADTGIKKVIIWYKGGNIAYLDSTEDVQPMNRLTVKFSESPGKLTASDFALEDGEIKSVTQTSNKLKCTLTFSSAMSGGRAYTLEIKPLRQQISFKTSEFVGLTVLKEDNTGFSSVYSHSAGTAIISGWNGREEKLFAPGFNENRSYVIYNTPGDLKSFEFNTYEHGGKVSGSEFLVSVSEDNVDYTYLEEDKGYTRPWNGTISGSEYVMCRKIKSTSSIPDNMHYLKIEFPQIVSSAGHSQSAAALGNGTVTSVEYRDAEIKDSGNHAASDKIYIRFGQKMNISTLIPQNFSVSNASIAAVSAESNSCTLTLAKKLSGNTVYIVSISPEVKTAYGGSIPTARRNLSLKTAYDMSYGESYWTNVKIGDGGMVTGVVVHPKDKSIIYARTDVGGMYRRDETARVWTPLFEANTLDNFYYGVSSIGLDPNNTDVVYAACAGMGLNKGCVLKSENRGNTWKKTGLSVQLNADSPQRIGGGETLFVMPDDSNTVFCGTNYDGMFVTHDGGETWKNVADIPKGTTADSSNFGDADIHGGVRTITADDTTGIMYAGVYCKGVYASADKGETWSLMPNSPTRTVNIETVGGTVYVSSGLAHNKTDCSGIFKYENGTWTDISPSADVGTTMSVMRASGGESVIAVCGHLSMLGKFWVKKGDSDWNMIVSESDKSREDITEFMPWMDAESMSILNYSASAMEFVPSETNGELWIATGSSVLHTGNIFDTSEKLTAEVNGIELLCVTSLSAPPQGDTQLFVGALDMGSFRITDVSTAHGAQLQPVLKKNGNNLVDWYAQAMDYDYCENNTDYVVTVRAGNNDKTHIQVAVSDDNGRNWDAKGWESNDDYYSGAAAISSDVTKYGVPAIVAITNISKNGSSTPVCKYSHDFGETWHDASGLPDSLLTSYGKVLSADRSNENVFYFYDNRNGAFYISTDCGKSFEKTADLPKDLSDYRCAAVESKPGTPGEIWVSASNKGLYRSTDYGASFSKVNNITNAEGVSFGADNVLYILGTLNGERGLYRVNDVGMTKLNGERQGIGLLPSMIAADRRIYGRVYVATEGRGVLMCDTAGKTPESRITYSGGATAHIYDNKLLNEKLVIYTAEYSGGKLVRVMPGDSKYISDEGALKAQTPENTQNTVKYFVWGEKSLAPIIN